MHKLSNIMSTAMVSLAMLCASCASEQTEPDYGDADGYRTLVLKLSLGDAAAMSRADFDNFDNELDKWGIAGENIETLRILILDGDNKVEYNYPYTLANDVEAGEYRINVRDDDTKTIVLLCNEDRLFLDEEGMEIVGGTRSLKQYFQSMQVGEPVDMAVLRRLTLALKPNSVDELGQSLRTPLPIAAIYKEFIAPDTKEFRAEYTMQRAAVKYSFRIINKNQFPQILEGVRIDRVADREFLFPDADYRVNELGHTVIADYRTPAIATEHVHTATLATPLKLPAKMPQAVQAMEPIYVPEGLQGDKAQKVSLTLNGLDLDIWQELKWRMPGESQAVQRPMVDLPRNTHVVVNITINPDETIDLVADVQPYGEVKVDPWLGLDRDEDGNIVVKRYDDGTYDVIINSQTVNCDSDGDRILKRFKDGSVLVETVIKRDYIHDENVETDYVYQFEKDRPGGNMVIIREKSPCGSYQHTQLPTDESHEHDSTDRPLFVLDTKGVFHMVKYNDGKATLSRTDTKGDTIVQANGFQFREYPAEMSKYYGTYIVELSDGSEELRYYKDGSTLDWEKGNTGLGSRSAYDNNGNNSKEISDKLKRAHRSTIAGRRK